MKFVKTEMDLIECYISGIYKVVNYGGKWMAFFKPSGWPSWGNACAKTPAGNTMGFNTIKQAQRACDTHLKSFGDNPSQFKSIVISMPIPEEQGIEHIAIRISQ